MAGREKRILSTQHLYDGLGEPFDAAFGTSNLPSALTVSGLPVEELLKETSKPLLPLEKAGVLVAFIIKMMAERLTTGKVGALSMEAILPSCLDFWNFVSDHRVQMMTTNLKMRQLDQKLDLDVMLALSRHFQDVLQEC